MVEHMFEYGTDVLTRRGVDSGPGSRPRGQGCWSCGGARIDTRAATALVGRLSRRMVSL